MREEIAERTIEVTEREDFDEAMPLSAMDEAYVALCNTRFIWYGSDDGNNGEYYDEIWRQLEWWVQKIK